MSVTGFLINGEKQKYDHRALDNAPIQPGEGDNSFVAVNETDPNEATEHGAVVLGGSNNTASGRNAAALGAYNIASGNNSISFGGRISGFDANESSNNGTIVIGSSSKATMPYAVAIGAKNEATASYAVAMGCQTTASGNLGFTSGYSTTASGAASVAMGRETTASAQYAMSIGYKTEATGASSVVFGQFNIPDTTTPDNAHGTGSRKYLVTVGNGNSANDKSNALSLDWDGNLVAAGSVSVDSIQVSPVLLNITETAPSTTKTVTHSISAPIVAESSASTNEGTSGEDDEEEFIVVDDQIFKYEDVNTGLVVWASGGTDSIPETVTGIKVTRGTASNYTSVISKAIGTSITPLSAYTMSLLNASNQTVSATGKVGVEIQDTPLASGTTLRAALCRADGNVEIATVKTTESAGTQVGFSSDLNGTVVIFEASNLSGYSARYADYTFAEIEKAAKIGTPIVAVYDNSNYILQGFHDAMLVFANETNRLRVIYTDTSSTSVNVNVTEMSGVFVATYGTTTSAEIEAAFQAGKFIYVEVPSNGRRMYLTVRISATEHRFGSIHYSDGIPAVYAANCVNDSWSGIGRTLVNQNSFATSFGDSQAYAIGDYCIHNGYLYRFTSAHAAGAWSDADATQVKLVDEVHNKVNANFGTANAGKFMVVGSDGIVAPVTQDEEVTISTAGAVTQALDAGKIYHFTGVLTALTITLNAAVGLSHYHFDFLSGATAPTLTMPNTVTMPDSFTVEANKRYEVDVLNSYGAVMAWAIS